MIRSFCFSRALALLILSAVGAAAEDAPRFTGQVVPQVAHTQEVLDIVYARSGAFLATSAGNGSVELWSAQGQRLRVFPRMDAAILGAIAFSPDGSYVVACTGAARRSYCQLFDVDG